MSDTANIDSTAPRKMPSDTGQSGASTSAAPRDVYDAGLAQATQDETRWKARAGLASNLRLACFAALLFVGWMAFGTHAIARSWAALPTIGFIVLIIFHDRVLRQEARAIRIRRFYEDGLARLNNEWAGRGDDGDRYRDPSHPYAEDLDVFGPGSMFELLATTRTTTGCDRLATWLCEAAEPETIRERQQAVTELRPGLSMRLEMAIAGDESDSATQQEALARWATAPAAGLSAALRFVAIALSSCSLGALALWFFSGSGPVPFALAVVVQGLFALVLRSRVQPVLAAAETPVGALARTASLLGCVEDAEFSSTLLARVNKELQTTGRPPSGELDALQKLVDRRDSRNNQFFAPIAALLLWGTHAAISLECWRARCGPRLAIWIDAAGEIEALSAFAGYAYEHPQDPFPEILDEGSAFEGEGLGHPLLPSDRCKRNDLSLGSLPQALVMSGSNMSGKSTMLRTVGCNTILALAGAPVRATRLRVSPLRLTASIRIVDSLQDGQSHFMAEVTRLRQVVEISRGDPKALFLLDEILHGTNSHDRLIGAEAVLKGLIAQGALGIVTTHDLALTQMVPVSKGQMANVHFEDHLQDGVMEFDYALRQGVVEKSNALELMRSVGLDV